MEGVGDRLTRRAVLVAGAGAVVAAGGYGRIPVAHAAAPPRDPRIIGSWGGFVIPATGCWFGADDTTRGFTPKTGIETELGRRMAIRNRRYGWLATCPSPQAVADAALTSPRVVVMCSFGQPSTFPCKTSGWSGREDLSTTAFGTGIDRITNGEFDSYWAGVASRLTSLGGPVIVRLWQEPNGQHNPYWAGFQGGVGAGGEQAYISAWRHVRSVFAAAGATIDTGGRCIFVYCAQRRSTQGTWEVYYPGDDVVDFVACDLYRDTLADSAMNTANDWNTLTFAAAHGKPYMVSESGFVQGQRVKVGKTSYDKDGSVTGNSLILNTYQSVMQNPWVVAYLPWNNSGPNGVAFVDTSTTSLAQYRQWANDPYFGLVLT
jgi:hypothetical protein